MNKLKKEIIEAYTFDRKLRLGIDRIESHPELSRTRDICFDLRWDKSWNKHRFTIEILKRFYVCLGFIDPKTFTGSDDITFQLRQFLCTPYR